MLKDGCKDHRCFRGDGWCCNGGLDYIVVVHDVWYMHTWSHWILGEKKEWHVVARIYNRALRTLKCSMSFHAPSCPATNICCLGVYRRRMVLINTNHWGLMPSAREYPWLYSWPFTVKFTLSVSNNGWLSMFTLLFDLAIQKTCQIDKYYEATALSMMVGDPMFLL